MGCSHPPRRLRHADRWVARRVLPPCLEPHMLRCCCYTTGNVRLGPASGRAPDSPRYKLGTSLSTPGRRNGVPAESRTRDSTFAESCDVSFTTGTEKSAATADRGTPSGVGRFARRIGAALRKLVARDGVAPPPPVLQTGALLRELPSRPSAWTCTTISR